MRIGLRYRAGCALCLLLLCLGFGPLTVAQAKVTIRGSVQLWRPDLNRYTPLKRVRVRMVLAEDYDSDTKDVETTCDDNGRYGITKGNPWWRKNYKAYPIVFAEVPDRLEIQDSYPQIDGYQAATGHVLAHQNATTTIDVNIGGPQSNVNYHVGGLAVLDNASSASADRGWRAFYLCDIATDHRLRLMARGFGTWEEKELVYPQNDSSVASYQQPWDYIRVPEGNFNDASGVPGLTRVSKSVRHEMSHGLMADTYWTWPGVFHPGSNPDSHTLDGKDPTREFAWSEAWAEFIGQVTQQDAWGSTTVDLETQNAPWHKLALKNGDATYIEGEIIASMWDIYDGVGTEECLEQNPDVPGTETFTDRISGGLDKIRQIFQNEHPHSFTHESFLGSSDSLVWYWVHKENFGQEHELKTILFNRGIRVNEIAQTKPQVTMGAPMWSGINLKIPYQVIENDAEDRPFVTVKVYAGQTLLGSRSLNMGWQGNANKGVFELSYAAKKGAPAPQFLLAVSDEMQMATASQTINPPADATIQGLAVRYVSLGVPPIRYLSQDRKADDLQMTLKATQNSNSSTLALPGKDGFGGGIMIYDQHAAEVFRTAKTDAPITLSLDVKGSVSAQGKKVPFAAKTDFATLSLLPENGYSVGLHEYELAIQDGKFVDAFQKSKELQKGQNDSSPVLFLYLTVSVDPATNLNGGIDFAKVFGLGAPVVLNYIPLDTAPKAPPEPAPGAPKAPPQTAAAAMSRANVVVKQVARLQAEASEINSELEWKMSPQGLARNQNAPDAAQMKAPTNATIRPLLNSPIQQGQFVVPTLSVSPFLSNATRGEGLVPSLDPSATEGLQDLADRSQQIETRLQALSVEATALQSQLEKANQGFLNPRQLSQRAPTAVAPSSRVTAMLANLAQIAPAVTQTRPILVQQRAVVAQGLKRVGAPLTLDPPVIRPQRDPVRAPEAQTGAPIINLPSPNLRLPQRAAPER